MLLLALASGCSDAAVHGGADQPKAAPLAVPSDPVEAILAQKLTAPKTRCTFNTTTGAVAVTVDSETAIISRRATDSTFVQNGFPCDNPASALLVRTISITGTSGDETVILDFANGSFASGTSSGPGISIDMKGGSGDKLGIRASGNADTITFGGNGMSVNADVYRDIVFRNGGEPASYALSLGAGDDKYTAAGGTSVGLTGAYAGHKPIAVYGGKGRDTFTEGAASTPFESLHGGEDSDTLTYATRAANHPVKITLGAGTNDDGEYDFVNATSVEADDLDSDIETITGTPGDDDMSDTAGTTTVTLNGGAGNDRLAGGSGNDVLNGGDGNDVFLEGAQANGSDVFNGGNGSDTVDYSQRTLALSVTMDGFQANDGEIAANEKDSVAADIENCYGGSGDDNIYGNPSNNVLRGGLGADRLSGGDGNDTFDEGDGDRSPTQVDDDVFVCGAGTDTVTYGGRTHDLTLNIDGEPDSGDQSLDPDGDGGLVSIPDGGSAPGEQDTIDLDCENLVGGSGVNHMTGSSGPNTLTGGASDDVIDGGGGSDVVDCGGGTQDVVTNTSGTSTNCEL